MKVYLWFCSVCLLQLTSADTSETIDVAAPVSNSLPHPFYGIRGGDTLDDLMAYIKTMRDPSSKRANYNSLSGKRASAGFHGMRGKKWYNLDYDTKRASAGFHGMRGKKDFEETNEGEDEDARPVYPELVEVPPCRQYNEVVDCPPDSAEVMKRGSLGFHGMRGKKETEWSLKRAMGFLGMRGKKMENPLNV